MQYRNFLILSLFIISAAAFGCGDSNTPANSANNGSANTNTAKTNPLDPPKKPEAPTTNNAPTLAPVYKAYCAAWVNKDEAALRKIYSSDTIKEFEKQMKEEGFKTLYEVLEYDQASNQLCEARNEQITGDTAIAEVRTKGYPNGIKIVFVKEAGEWKMTNKSPEVDAVKPTTTVNQNTAK